MTHYKHYTYKVTWSQEDHEYVGLCVEFPSLSYLAKEQENALNGVIELIRCTLEDMKATGEIPPEPFSERSFSGRFQIRIPPQIHRLLTLLSAEQGISLNRYINLRLAGE